VNSATYVVLINGESTQFFQSGRGLRQGCPPSPLLFILVMEGLGVSLKKDHVEGKLTEVKVFKLIKILRLLFVHDVLIMSKASIEEWKVIDEILNVFFKATGLVVNLQNSTFHYFWIQQEVINSFKDIFPYNFVDLSEGFR
jgi:hypothetical protein